MNKRRFSGGEPRRGPPTRGPPGPWRRPRPSAARSTGLHYDPEFLDPTDEDAIVRWLTTLHPLWEYRFSELRPPPEGQEQRRLLRPVYWLGNWQFACLDYYRPPHGVLDRCVAAEPFPPVLARVVSVIEQRARGMFRHDDDMPAKWHLNTCLVNFYGNSLEGG